MTPPTLRATLTALGLSISAAARALGISRATMTRYLNGQLAIPRTVELALDGLRHQSRKATQ